MLKIRRIYNQNRKKIRFILIIIVFLLIVLRFLNYLAGMNTNIENNIYENVSSINSNYDYNSVSVESNKSALTGNKTTERQVNAIDVIDSFFEYCNKKDIKSAYDLITDECKEEMYPKIQDFEESYYKQLFDGTEKIVSIENWIGNIYKVDIKENAMATGRYDTDNIKQDYITIEEIDDDNYKLNINSYIGRTELNKSSKFRGDSIEIKVLRKDTYMDTEEYTIEVTNNANVSILLDNLLDINNMYIKDDNELKYYAYTHELNVEDLIVHSNATKKITIKYYSRFGSQKNIKGLGFSKIVMNYEAYNNLKNKNIFKDYYDCYIEF